MEQLPNQHPSFEDLLSLVIGELPGARKAEIQEHLGDCPECLSWTRSLLHLSIPPPASNRAAETSLVRLAWFRLLETVARRSLPSSQLERPFVVLPGAAPIRLDRARPVRQWRSLAAAAVLAWGIGLTVGRSWIGPILAPTPAFVTYLTSDQYIVRGDVSPLSHANCPPAGGAFVWILSPLRQPASADSVVVRIIRNGQPQWEVAGLPNNSHGEVTITIPWSAVPDGNYKFELEAEPNGPMETFAVSVACR